MVPSSTVTESAMLLLKPTAKCIGLQSVETIHGWMPKDSGERTFRKNIGA